MIANNYNNRLYGRIRGRNKKKITIDDYQKLISNYTFSRFKISKNYILDIGSGSGETTVYLAKKFPKYQILACEKYIEGNLNLLKQIKIYQIENISIYSGNVYDVFNKYSLSGIFQMVWIFFPDPWPKKKHFKRRLISKSFFEKIYPLMKNSGQITITTDSVSYSRSIINTLYECKNLFNWKNQGSGYLDIKDYYDLETKFYKKAIISGRNSSIFIIEKI